MVAVRGITLRGVVLLGIALLGAMFLLSSLRTQGPVSAQTGSTMTQLGAGAQRAAGSIHTQAILRHPRKEDIVLLTGTLQPSVAQQHVQSSNQSAHLSPHQWEHRLNLVENAIPPNIHIMWCRHGNERWYEFKHYLSALSALRALSPHLVVFHYDFVPNLDSTMYNLWLDDLKKDFQYFVMKQMDGNLAEYCRSDRDTKIGLILELLKEEGGLYLSENTWLLNFPMKKRMVDLEVALEPTTLDGYILMRKEVYQPGTPILDYFSRANINATRSACSPIHQIYHGDVKTTCINVVGEMFERFYPMDIWERDDPFGRLSRLLFYGSEEINMPKPSYDELVPNIGHMIWIGGGAMDFVFYLSLLSMLFVANVDVVFIHGDTPPTGPYWEKLQTIERIRSRIKCIQTTQPLMVYQGVIEPWYRALMSDIIRVDLMIKYGGVYMDTDAIWTRPLSFEDRGYEAVACFDWVDWSYPFPDSVNFGISYGKKNAPFWRLFRDSMRTLHNEHHGYTGVMYPYKILEKFPNLLRIDKRLSVICYHSLCHPIWVDDYHNMNKNHVVDNSIPNWREDVHAFHWTYPNPPEYANETTLLAATGIFAEVGKNILDKAGLL